MQTYPGSDLYVIISSKVQNASQSDGEWREGSTRNQADLLKGVVGTALNTLDEEGRHQVVTSLLDLLSSIIDGLSREDCLDTM